MGRPKGSKNKPKYEKLMFTPELITKTAVKIFDFDIKEKEIEGTTLCTEPVVAVEKKSRMTRRKKIREELVIESQELQIAKKSRRSSAKSATKQMEDTSGQESSSQKVVVGWVNMQKIPDNMYYRNNYFTGADIHKTLEDARKAASKNTVGQFFVSCEVKE